MTAHSRVQKYRGHVHMHGCCELNGAKVQALMRSGTNNFVLCYACTDTSILSTEVKVQNKRLAFINKPTVVINF